MTGADYAIFVNGSYGVGKSSTLDHIGDLLATTGRPFALMDVDWFHRSWPPPDDDPNNQAMEAANMGAFWANYRRAGRRQLVVAGVLADRADHARYERALMLPVRSVRLEAATAVAAGRLENRYRAHRVEALAWHLSRHAELAKRLQSADLDERVFETSTSAPAAVAKRVVDHFAGEL